LAGKSKDIDHVHWLNFEIIKSNFVRLVKREPAKYRVEDRVEEGEQTE
jgi:hypothetical protein